MQAMLKTPTPVSRRKPSGEADAADLEVLITAMGKRLQTEYIEGAIPYLRMHEPELWARLEELDADESLDALIEYELLFFEGMNRYVGFLNRERKAA